ncbi:hypothetical protein [Caulobacter sp. DWR1-3-2b1]|uniref:hypothetical protein n=1 Tax=Caulobacter sp. DWR1-3-2b1 TaxID=2804670 RepID=UPI003CED4991
MSDVDTQEALSALLAAAPPHARDELRKTAEALFCAPPEDEAKAHMETIRTLLAGEMRASAVSDCMVEAEEVCAVKHDSTGVPYYVCWVARVAGCTSAR